jgi:hypothetical protein
MERFIHRDNLARFTNLLGAGIDPARRTTLMSLLVSEEDQYGYGHEQLGVAEQFVADCQDHITKLRVLIESLSQKGQSTTKENDMLETLVELKHKFERYRDKIAQRVL